MTMEPTNQQLRAWATEAIKDEGCYPSTSHVFRACRLAYAAGTCAERRACIEVLDINGAPGRFIAMLCDRHPKPPSLKQQALEAMDAVAMGRSTLGNGGIVSFRESCDLIRRALKLLPDEQ